MNHTYTLENLEHIVNKITDVKIRKKSRQRKYVIARHIFFKIAQTFVTPKISAITKFLKMHHASLLHHKKSFVRDIINDDYNRDMFYKAVDVFTNIRNLEEENTGCENLKKELINLKVQLCKSKAYDSRLEDLINKLSRLTDSQVQLAEERIDLLIKSFNFEKKKNQATIYSSYETVATT